MPKVRSLSSPHFVWSLALCCAVLGLSACQQQEPDAQRSTRGTRRARLTKRIKAGSVAAVLDATKAPRALARDAIAAKGLPPGVLPKYKTASELAHERQRKQGLVLFDQFDTFRQQYVSYYYPTKAPVGPFRVVAEYEDSQAWLIAWPGTQGADGDKFISDMIVAGWGTAPLILTYSDATHQTWLKTQLTNAGLNPNDTTKVSYLNTPADSIWSRDFGPFSIKNTSGTGTTVSFVDFRYYHERVLDDQVPTALAQSWGINVFRPDFELEGGNFMATSDGLCASSKGALWYNPQLTQSAIEQLYADYLGCKKTLFPTPLTNEGTSHLDMFSKFADDTHMLVGEYTTAQDAQNKPILDANATLFATQTPSGATMNVIRIPMPSNSGQQIWRTFTNSLSLKRGSTKKVIIPVFSDQTTNQAAALTAYAQAYPGWTLATVDSKAVISWGGAVHCTTMQIAEGTHAKMETDPAPLCSATSLTCSGSVGCGNITDVGCCDGTVLRYCDQGQLGQLDCASAPSCGWSAQDSWYDCGTSGGADPSGQAPKACGGTTPTTDGGVTPTTDKGTTPTPDSGGGCGSVTYEGCCNGDELRYCENGTLTTMACSAGTCGWEASGGFYDCGTSGAADPSGAHPKNCGGVTPTTDGGVTPTTDSGTTPGCGNVRFEGCCNGDELRFCENGVLQAGPCSPGTCGWDATAGYYDCNTSGAADPSGANPKNCGGVTPATDGGVAPTTDSGTTPGCGNVTVEGCCSGDELRFCENGVLQAGPCSAGTCGWNDTEGYYDCDTTGAADPSGAHPKSCGGTVTPKDGGTVTPKDSGTTPKLDSGTTPTADSGWTPTPDAGVGPQLDSGTKKSSSSGGCAVAGSEATTTPLWLLGLLGLAFWRRRASR